MKEILVKIEMEGRDKGKVFQIKEMSAKRVEKWAYRAFLALTKNGVTVPPDVENAGIAGLVAMGMGVIGKVPFAEAEVLMDEMFECVSFVPSPGIVRPLIDRGSDGDDIEEVRTRLKLRSDIVELHTGFSIADALSKWMPGMSATASPSSPIPTSRAA